MGNQREKTSFKSSNRGASILEIMIMSMIVLIAASALIGFLVNSLKLINRNRARAFALEKCNQMIEEVTAYSLAGEDVTDIDRFKNLTPSPLLSADTTVSDPENALSGNVKNKFGNWKYLRVIDVLPIRQEPRTRIVSVKVYYNDNDNPGETGLLLAQLTKLLKTAGNIFPPMQVYDVYSIAIENTPGWWVDMFVMKPMMQQAINQIQARNPGLEYRVHWITRNGFGRDPYYSPYFNDSKDATDAGSLPYVYIYPSAIVGADDFYYYPPRAVLGNKTVDGTMMNNGVYPYPLADYYNNAVRYPEEQKRYNAMAAQYAALGFEPPQPSLGQFFQQMYDDPEEYKNVLIFNLHGELIPLPPVRNYSDPAKRPGEVPNLRVVSHPENMLYVTGEDVRLRVYAYYTDPDNHDASSAVDTICLFFPGVDLTGDIDEISKCEGCDTIGYCWIDAVSPDNYSISHTTVGGALGTLIELFDTPARAPWNPTSGSSNVLQAEDGNLFGGCKARKEGTSYPPDHTDYHGTGFVDRFTSSGRGVWWSWSPPEDGNYEIITRYGNNRGHTARRTIKKHTSSGWSTIDHVYLPDNFSSWDQWGEAPITAHLTTDVDAIKFEWTSGDYEHINLDELRLTLVGSAAYDETQTMCVPKNSPETDYNFMFHNCPPNAVGDGALYVSGKGDIGSSSEYYKVYADGDYIGRVLNQSLSDCSGNWLPSPPDAKTLSESDLQDWVSDGDVVFRFKRNGINNKCDSNCLRVRFTYDTTSVPECTPGGLDESQRLYGLEYIPCPVTASNDFSQDLTNEAQNVPKNTARWVIQFADADFPDTTMVNYFTFIGPKDKFGIPLYNRSENYIWRSIAPPLTEQLQLLGDPRLMPYADIKANGGYNWFFWSQSISGYSGFNKCYNHLWHGESDRIDVDIPKAFMEIRHAITRADAIWNPMTGYSNYYIGLGQEIGGDAANHPEYNQGIPMKTTSWTNDVSPANKVDEITSSYERNRIPGSRDNSWTAFPWLGELYPDSNWSDWQTEGNLKNDNFSRNSFTTADWGGDHSSDCDRIKRTQGPGCISFFNCVPEGTSPSTKKSFTHYYYGYSSKADITTEGESLAVRFRMPLADQMRAARPFVINSTDPPHGWPNEWNDSYYENLRYESELENVYYTYGDDKASAIINLYPPSSDALLTGHIAHFLVNGLSPSKDQGASWIVMYGLASMTQAFLDEGNPSKPAASRIHQIPRIEITEPDANSAVDLTFDLDWETKWLRWDNLKYSYQYPSGFQENDNLIYALKYSPDGGRHWFYKSDNQPTETGKRPDSGHIIDSGPVTLTFANEGVYIVRVECYREDILTHYAYHQIRVLAMIPR